MKASIVAVFAVVMLVACGGSSKDETLTVADWASEVCRLAAAVDQAEADSVRSVPTNPATLTLEERKARGRTLSDNSIRISQQYIDAMTRLKPPTETDAFHRALIDRVAFVKAARERGQIEAANATSVTELEEINSRFTSDYENSTRVLEMSARLLSDNALEALSITPGCASTRQS